MGGWQLAGQWAIQAGSEAPRGLMVLQRASVVGGCWAFGPASASELARPATACGCQARLHSQTGVSLSITQLQLPGMALPPQHRPWGQGHPQQLRQCCTKSLSLPCGDGVRRRGKSPPPALNRPPLPTLRVGGGVGTVPIWGWAAWHRAPLLATEGRGRRGKSPPSALHRAPSPTLGRGEAEEGEELPSSTEQSPPPCWVEEGVAEG